MCGTQHRQRQALDKLHLSCAIPPADFVLPPCPGDARRVSCLYCCLRPPRKEADLELAFGVGKPSCDSWVTQEGLQIHQSLFLCI